MIRKIRTFLYVAGLLIGDQQSFRLELLATLLRQVLVFWTAAFVAPWTATLMPFLENVGVWSGISTKMVL